MKQAELIVQNYIESKRPKDPKILELVDLGYSFDGKEFLLFELRPFQEFDGIMVERPFAKLKFVKKDAIWKLYWMRANEKWKIYQPCDKSKNIQELIKVIDEDKLCCFYG